MQLQQTINEIESLNSKMLELAKAKEWDDANSLAQKRQQLLQDLFKNNHKNSENQQKIQQVSDQIFKTDALIQQFAKESKSNSMALFVQLKLQKKASSAYQEVANK